MRPRSRQRRHGADFFKSDLRAAMPETVYILGPGLNGVRHYKQIPAGAFVIVLNRAIKIPGVPKSLWMVMDGLCVTPGEYGGWFYEGMQSGMRRLFGGIIARRIDCHYSFEHLPKWHQQKRYIFIHAVLRGGRGILGCALQACLWASHTLRVIMIGCDGKGPYYDGTSNAFLKIPDSKVRNEFPDLQIMIDEMTRPDDQLRPGQHRPKRMEVLTLSETVLRVPIAETINA